MKGVEIDRIEQFKRLAAINRAITTSLDFHEVLRLIVANAVELVDARACLVLLADRDGMLRIRAARGLDDEKVERFAEPMEESAVERLRVLLELEPHEAFTTVPVLSSHVVNGLLAVALRDSLDPEEQWFLSALADQAGIALGNARLHEMEVEQWRWESTRLAAVSRQLSALLDLGTVVDIVCSAARELAAADAATFALREGEEVYYACEDGRAPLWKGQRFPIQGCISGWSVLDHAPVIVEDVHADPRIRGEAFRSTFVKSLAIVPVRAQDPLGAIGVYWASAHRASEREVELIESLAAAAAVAIENALLYEQMKAARVAAEQRAELLLQLEEFSARLLMLGEEPPTYDQLIEIICRVTGAALGVFWSVETSHPGGAFLYSEYTYGLQLNQDNEFDRQQLEYLRHLDLNSSAPSARAARSMSLVVVPDLRADEAREHFPDVERAPVRSLLAIPLRVRGRLLGVVTLFWREPNACGDESIMRTSEVLVNLVAAALDIAELVKELSRVNRLKDEFLATLSHELRNPLNAIVGFSQLLLRSPEAQRSASIRHAAEVIRRNAFTQTQLVSDLLDLSRLQTGKFALNRQIVVLSPIIADAVETVRGEAASKRITLKMELASEPLIVEADAVRAQQIAWNLLNNAVKFTPNGGQVTVILRQEGKHAKLVVEDTGEGIEPEFLPHVFEMFRQADGTMVRRHGGMGIGLALVRQLVELHGGQVQAESEGVGHGARFSVWLPLHSTTAEALSTTAETAGKILAGIRILVVDDSRDTVEILQKLLESEGARVQTAINGLGALGIARDADFDLILSDISMPGMDGYELLHELRRHPRTAKMPAVALTGFGQADDVEKARTAGFITHLTKPVDFPELIKVARDATANSQLN